MLRVVEVRSVGNYGNSFTATCYVLIVPNDARCQAALRPETVKPYSSTKALQHPKVSCG